VSRLDAEGTFDRSPGDWLDQVIARALRVGAVALAVCLVVGLLLRQDMAAAYLVGFLFWIGIATGCLGLSMLHHLVGGQWGLPIRRPLEAGGMTVFPLALLFLPIAGSLGHLYPWAGSEAIQSDPALEHQKIYLNPTFFLGRALLYFAVWGLLAWLLRRWSLAQDATADVRPSRWLQVLSGPGLVVLFVTCSFAAIDWGMSLKPRWASTMYGPMLVTGSALATLAVMILVCTWFLADTPLGDAATPPRLHDLGNLLLAFVMLWAYMSFSQFLIIWSGNLSEEAPWYIRRTQGGWQYVAVLLIIAQFFLPFFILLSREAKRKASSISTVAWVILVMHLVDLTWLIIPATSQTSRPQIRWAALPLVALATAGIGAICTAFFLGLLKRQPLIPLRDPRLGTAAHEPGGE
jgi:hypothetical protein